MRFRTLIVAFFAICLGLITVSNSALALAPRGMTYDDVKNSGLANSCLDLLPGVSGAGSLEVGDGTYITELCLEPTQIYVKEEAQNLRRPPEFVPGEVMTADTTVIESVSGPLEADGNGLTFYEEDGFDFQAITVQIPGPELVPFLFTVKELVAKADSSVFQAGTTFEGGYTVPSYRTSNFLDPKGRGIAAGYDNAVARPAAADDTTLERANKKRFVQTEGEISMLVSKVDPSRNEFVGTFVAEQLSDPDLGASDGLEVKIEGRFYGIVS